MSAQVHPFDLLLALILGIGVFRGRKRGMSEELLDVVEWVVIVVGCGLAYRHVSNLLGAGSMPVIWADILSYLLIGAIIMLIFKSIKRAVGEKLIEGDTFGRFEYYLGMLSGALRFFCVTFVFLALLNAKYVSPAERAANVKMQQENFGSISFPTLASLQQEIFKKSFSGTFIGKNLKPLLIKPVASGPSGDGIGRRRERAVNEIIGN
jgi:uncharacterized membrane protein required for colicin V production